MSEEKLFVRDPREVPFLHGQVQKMLAFADNSSRGISIREDADFGFMAIQFLYKQIQHTESVLLLIPRRDAGLIARTMIEGLYQLLWASQEPEERARRWRSFSVIHNWRLIQGRQGEGVPVDEAEIRKNEALLKVFGDQHRLNNPRANSPDPYHKNWRGGVSLADMADAVIGRKLYDGSYAELSDWAHWGLSGIGDAISQENNHITVNTNSDRIAGLSLLAAFLCLLQTLALADVHCSLNLAEIIQNLESDFIATMASFRQR